MIKIKLSTLWLLMTITILVSCQRTLSTENIKPPGYQPPISKDSMFRCHYLINWDSVSISNKLIGLWQWEFIECYWNPENANSEDYKGLTVEFKTDKTVIVKDNGQVLQTSTWGITKLNDGYYKIDATPIVGQLFGKILFCDDRVVFSDTYVDGCDNYFKQK